MSWFKWILASVFAVIFIVSFAIVALLYASLPKLDDDIETQVVSFEVFLHRDTKGMAVVSADNQYDASYALGFAHAQDRLFQMDLLRRQAAGELSEFVGDRALEVDKKYRFHQFKQRAQNIYAKLSKHEKKLLSSYSHGVNEAYRSLRSNPPEYYLLSKDFKPWTPTDSLLAIFSMYIDLQGNQIEIDFSFEALKTIYGEPMHEFFNLPSLYQSSIDKNEIQRIESANIPNPLPTKDYTLATAANGEVQKRDFLPSLVELPDIGSNNWVVSGELTDSQSAMLSNDMHLGLAVPSIWYKAQLNYQVEDQDIQITGVSLPGTPVIIVGSTENLAWGFTNSGIDSADWVKLSADTVTHQVTEVIKLENSEYQYSFEMSEFGPVRELTGQKYALKWVAHEPYAINFQVINLAHVNTVKQGLEVAKSIRIPAQNLVLADKLGNIGWQLTGAITARTNPKQYALNPNEIDELWEQPEPNPAYIINPPYNRLWTANARVVSANDDIRYGNGGYALGVRQLQIQQRLFEKSKFNEQDFYTLQLDNEALFLKPWHKLLLSTLNQKSDAYNIDIQYLKGWKACACPDSVGYTLVRKFRSALVTRLLEPVTETLEKHDIQSRHLLRNFETSVWQIIEQEPPGWLPGSIESYQELYLKAYLNARKELSIDTDGYLTNTIQNFESFAWGNVNKMKVTHPFAGSLGPFGKLLNMPEVDGYGDSYMPAVQKSSFGASQRFIVRPGNLDKAIMTIPGGQSGHFLSRYYDAYFEEYATNANSPLLPQEITHTITFTRN